MCIPHLCPVFFFPSISAVNYRKLLLLAKCPPLPISSSILINSLRRLLFCEIHARKSNCNRGRSKKAKDFAVIYFRGRCMRMSGKKLFLLLREGCSCLFLQKVKLWCDFLPSASPCLCVALFFIGRRSAKKLRTTSKGKSWSQPTVEALKSGKSGSNTL